MAIPTWLKAIFGGGGQMLYASHRKHRAKEKRRVKRSKKENEKFMNKFGKEKYMKFPNMTKKQNALLQELTKGAMPGQQTSLEKNPLYQKGSAYLQDLLSQSPQALEAYKAPILQNFQEDILPQIISKYGGTSPENSSALRNELSRAGTDLGTRLGALRGELQGQGVEGALRYAAAPEDLRTNQQQLSLGTRPYNAVYRPPTPPGSYQAQPSWLQSFLGGAAPGIGSAIGAGIGGPAGASIGQGIGSGVGNASQPRQQGAAQPLYSTPKNFG
jgi:hypothetical protein